MAFGLSAATIGTIAGIAVSGSLAAFSIHSVVKSRKEAKKLPTTARARVRQLEKQIEAKEKKLFTTTNEKTREKLRLEIQDLRDEKIILEKDLEQQHDIANELSGKDTAATVTAQDEAKPGMSGNTKLLLGVGGVLLAGGVVVYVATRKRKGKD